MKKISLLLLGAALSAAVQLPALECCVKIVNGVPRLMLDGKPASPRLYAGNGLRMETLPLALDAGVELYQIVDYNLKWEGEGDEKYKEFDDYCERVLKADHRIKLIPRIKMDIPATPYVRQHPELRARLENGYLIHGYTRDTPMASINDPGYRAALRQALKEAIIHLEAKFGDRMAGYHPSCCFGGEWLYWEYRNPRFHHGFDAGTQKGFRRWLEKKYKTDAALAKAWQKEGMTFDKVTVPTGKERRGEKNAAFLNPQRDRSVIDFHEFLCDDMADAVLEMARVVREVCGKKKLSCAFYGYTCTLGPNPLGPSNTGHFALRKVLDSPDIDVLCGPFSYGHAMRSLGGGEATLSPAESVALAGKLWLNEDDNGTHLAVRNLVEENRAPDFPTHRFRTQEETCKLFRRDLAFTYLRNQLTWWFDLWGQGWHNDPKLWEETKLFLPLEQKLLANPVPYEPEMAIFFDEKSMHYVVGDPAPYEQMNFCCFNILHVASLSAVPYGQYLLSDALRGKVEKSKIDIYCNAVALNSKERAILKTRAAKNVSVWLWAPGLIDTDFNTCSFAAMKDLTGFLLMPVETRSMILLPTREGLGFGLPEELGRYDTGKPQLAVAKLEEGDIVLARYDKTKSPAIVYRPAGNGRAASLFCGGRDLPPHLIRRLARIAGAKVWSKEDLHVQTQGGVAAFTAPSDGAYAIDTGWDCELRNALTGKSLGRGPKLIREFTRGETLIVEKGK